MTPFLAGALAPVSNAARPGKNLPRK